jgi:adenylate kinase
VAPPAINQPFSPVGTVGKTKLLILDASDSPAEWMDRARSLNIEHVSPAALLGREISPKTDLLALMRRWFFGRKPDAGFLLTDFPATLLQAKVFDEWLEARGEALNAVYGAAVPASAVAVHYRILGLLAGPTP